MAVWMWFQDQVEEADGRGSGAPGRGGELLGPAENVPVALLLPPEPARDRGQQHGGRRGRGHVQQHVPDSLRAPPRPPETSGPEGAHSRPRAGGATGAKPPARHAARAVSP